jgi:hypothetical protein
MATIRWDRGAEALYAVLENEIIPEFYRRDEQGIPRSWVARIRESMAVLTPEFSANRTVRQYTDEQYIPAAAAFARRACGDSELTASFLDWQEEIAANWNDVHFGELNVSEQEGDLVLSGIPRSADRIPYESNLCRSGIRCGEMRNRNRICTRPEFPGPYRPASDHARIATSRAGIADRNRRILWQR